MVRFARPPGVSGFDIVFKNDGAGDLHGYAYTHGTSYHRRNGRCPPVITIHVPKWFNGYTQPQRKQARRSRREIGRERQRARGYLPQECFTNHERLLHIIAHELRHLWQRKVKRGRRVWGSRGQYSERDADAWGIRCVRRWRRRVEVREPWHFLNLLRERYPFGHYELRATATETDTGVSTD